MTILAHLADLHLGYRAYDRSTAAGINQREADVANAFRAAVDGVLAARPDVVVIAGDLFHQVRPANTAIVFAFQQLARLRTALPDAPIIVAAGNHETPRAVETGSILPLFEELGVDLAMTAPRRFSYPALDLAVLVVPEPSLWSKLDLIPQGDERHQVLVLHGEVEGVIGPYGMRDRQVKPGDLVAGGWGYVALGHYHVQHEVAPRVWYAGALEYTSSDPWGEVAEEARLGHQGKGWLRVDLETGTVTRQPVPSARTVWDCPRLDATDLPAADVDRGITEALQGVPGGLTGAVVRLVVDNIPKHIQRELDHARIRKFKANALHFHLDHRHPDTVTGGRETRDAMRKMTLPELLQAHLAKHPLPARLDRGRFVQAGMDLLAELDSPDDT